MQCPCDFHQKISHVKIWLPMMVSFAGERIKSGRFLGFIRDLQPVSVSLTFYAFFLAIPSLAERSTFQILCTMNPESVTIPFTRSPKAQVLIFSLCVLMIA